MKRARKLPPLGEHALLIGLGIVAVQAPLIPLEPGGGLVAPDLLYGLVIAWMIRRPATTPLWIAPALGLFADVMLSRPLGLGAIGLLLAAEWFRGRARRFWDVPFVIEWLAATAGSAVILAGMQIALEVVFANPPGVPALLRYLLATSLAYPVVVLGLTWCLQIRAPRSAAFGAPMGRLW